MSAERVVQNMMNLARHSGLIAEGKDELFKTFLTVVYQSARFDAIIEKAAKPYRLVTRKETKDESN